MQWGEDCILKGKTQYFWLLSRVVFADRVG